MLNEDRIRRLILQIAFCLCLIPAFAQEVREVKGYVSGETGPIQGAHLYGFYSKKLLGYSDMQGAFKVQTKDSVLLITMIGYEPVQVRVSDQPMIVSMTKQTGLLDQVVVSESKGSKQLKESTVSLDLIQPKLIETTAPIDIENSLNRLNGVQIVDGQANIRSGSGWSYGAGSRVQVLVNGLPMLSGDANQALWSFIPTEGVDRVEVIKGAASVIYGSSALNGVINVHTRSSAANPYSTVSLSTGVYDLPKRASLREGNSRSNLSNVSAFHLGKVGDMDLHVGLNLLHDAGFKLNDFEDRARTSMGLRKVWTDKQMILGANAAIQMGNSGNFLLWDSYEKGYTTLDSGKTETQTLRINVDPYWSLIKADWKHEIRSRYLKVSNQVDNGDTSTDQSNYSDLIYTEYQASGEIKPLKLKVVGGLVWQYSETRSPLFDGRQSTQNSAIYTQLERKWRGFLINAGMRYEEFQLNERKESRPVFRSGINYRITKGTFARFSYGQGYRFPSVAETYITTSVGPVSIFPNPSLSSESGSNLEFGLKQGYRWKKFSGMIDLAVYRMQFNNMTEFMFAQWGNPLPPNYGAGFKSVNAGKARIRGIELSHVFNGKLGEVYLQGFMGYNYTLPEALEPDAVIAKDFNEEPLTYRSTSSDPDKLLLKYRPLHQFKGDIILEYKAITLGYGLSYQSEIENIDEAFVNSVLTLFVPGVDSAMRRGLTSFLLQNLRLGYAVNEYLRLNLIIQNLSNREYMIRPADLGAPRSFRLQISYTFK